MTARNSVRIGRNVVRATNLAIVLLTFTVMHGAVSAADEPPAKPVKAARISGPAAELSPISPEGGWTTVPEILAGTQIGKQPLPRSGEELTATVEADGLALVAVLWKHNIDYARTYDAFHPALDAIRKRGWETVAVAVRGDEFNGAKGKLERLVVFRRPVKAGEKLTFPEKGFDGPFPVIADDKKSAEIAAAVPAIVPSNDLGVLSPAMLQAKEGPFQSRGIVALDVYPQGRGLDPQDTLLYREVMRQALLVAARDELGLATRDGRLQELLPGQEKGGEPPLGIFFRPTGRQTLAVTLFRATVPEPSTLYDFEIPAAPPLSFDALVTHAEQLSRTELVAALRAAGYSGQPRKPVSSAKAPDGLEDRLSDFNFIAQFALVRNLHREIFDQGESPELVSALARAYAHLGSVTDYLWSPAHKAFEARALLYAERLVARHGDSPGAYRTRAWARAVVGRHQAALEDLQKANDLAAGKKPDRATPIDVIEACCRFDRAKQRELAERPDLRPLLDFFRLQEIEYAGTERLRMDATGRILEQTPDCYKAMHMLATGETLGVIRTAISQSFLGFSLTLYSRIKNVPGLPKAAEEIVTARGKTAADAEDLNWPDEIVDRRRLVAALRSELATGDAGNEPSLGSLAHLIEETGFLQVWRSVDVTANLLGLPADESIKAFEPIFESHRFADFIRSFVSDPTARREALVRLLAIVQPRVRDLEFTAVPLVRAAVSQDRNNGSVPYLITRIDPVYRDFAALHWARASQQVRLFEFKRKRDISPHAPLMTALQIQLDWPNIAPRAKQIEETYADEILVIGALSSHYIDAQDWEAAERCLQREVKISPEALIYRRLSTIYRKRGKMDEWRKTLDEYLNTQEDLGLEHSVFRAEIADYLMDQGDFKQALPYAVGASKAYSSRGLNCALRCYDGLEDWDRAEQFAQAAAERYEGDRLTWYQWCRERNRGDVEAAKQLAAEWVSGLGSPPPPNRLNDVAAFFLIAGEFEQAQDVLEPGFKQFNDPYLGLQAALAADAAGRKEDRDRLLGALGELLKKLPAKGRPRKELMSLAGLFAAALQPDGKFDTAAFDELLKTAKTLPGEQTNLKGFAGRFLLKNGDRQQAIDYLKQAATSAPGPFNRTLARITLSDEKVEFGSEQDDE